MCGIIAILLGRSAEGEVPSAERCAQLLYDGLCVLQHRGQVSEHTDTMRYMMMVVVVVGATLQHTHTHTHTEREREGGDS